MAKYTEYLRLVKPEGNEYYNVEQFNHNAELIDKETEKLNNAVTKIQEGATKEKKGIVQFGTEEGKALEGMMLARLAGCVGYGGDIQEPGVKDINYLYYDRNTRKMYMCLNQNSDVSANVANFIPLDNNSLLDKLKNLFKYEVKNATSRVTNCNNATLRKIKLDRLCIMHYQVDVDAKASLNTKITVYFDETFADIPFATITDNNSGTSELANPVLDWATTTQVTMSNFASGFSLMVIGYI
jgi:hypothetical protein